MTVLDPVSVTAPVFEGEFETHVTVRCDEVWLRRFEGWIAGVEGAKLTHIVLGRGRMRSQPMLTVTGSGSSAGQRAVASSLVRRLVADGFEPVRVKIEASPWAAGVPGDDAAAVRLGPGFYFEHHVKLVLDPDFEWEALADLVIPHGAHVSWNARRVLGAGRQERFVTQRCHGVGLPRAGERLAQLCAVLRGTGYEIVSIEREFVVFDSDASVDDGWIDSDLIDRDGVTR